MDMSDKEFYNKRLQNEMNRNNVIDRAGDLEKEVHFLRSSENVYEPDITASTVFLTIFCC
ncbi:hypothetical protein BLA28_11000 [Eisenbergiella tayi]|nr:hypothetical protein BLA28_11000 [Eisenbergiella tayi]